MLSRNTAIPAVVRLLAGAFLLATSCLPLSAQTKLLRFPDIHDNHVVFTYGGDLWQAPSTGGTAVRLTAHPGLELFAKYSPDGKWIAFTGQYDGDEQVYMIPSTGGEPKQLTYFPARGPLAPRWGYDNQVYGWSNDGKYVIFRTMRDGWALAMTRLYRVSVDGGPAEPLPMPVSGAGSFSPGGNQIVYSPQARDFRPEKRYSGGTANQLYIFDVETHAAKRISEGTRSSRDPMWIGKQIYFNSDRDGHFNLYAYDTATGKTAQVTKNTVWDVRWPSSDRERRIVYELDGELNVLDVKSGKSEQIAIQVPDDGINRRASRVSAAGLIEDADLSPKGERVLFSARGDIFTAPVEHGPTRNLTRTPGAHDKAPAWSPDGTKIAFLSDSSGEEEIWVVAQDGSSAPEQITSGGKVFRYDPKWSPDGKRIAFSDKDGKLWVVTLADKKLQEVTHSPDGAIRDYAWSPGGSYLAFSMNKPDGSGFSALHVWSIDENKVRQVTSGLFNEDSPAWDPKGDYLYYRATHEFHPLISQSEFDFATNRGEGFFVLALRKDVKNPFPLESDEVTIKKDDAAAKDKPADKDKDKDKDKKAEEPVKDKAIDWDGLAQRVTRVPIDADNYSELAVKSDALLYATGPAPYYGREAETKGALHVFSFKDRKDTKLVDDIGGWVISRDGSKVLVRQGGAWNLYDASASGASSKKTISTAGLMLDRVPAEEWKQIFNEVWRRYRDFFYAPNMHGQDWNDIHDRYAKLLPYVAHRSDLNYVLSEMISELTVQHTYIDGGDFQLPPRPHAGLPGARFEVDSASGRYRIAKIFDGQNEEEIYRSPLTEVGVDAKAGDYVLAINGEDVTAKVDIYKYLRNAGDAPVMLTLNSKPVLEGARKVTYKPLKSETDLIYYNWVEQNRRKVDELSHGRIGYIHLPDMGEAGIREFIKWYYPQLRKDALLIDDRSNGGGNISRMVIERLTRNLLSLSYARTITVPRTYPNAVFIGPKAVLLDQNSASDGDIFPWMFRTANLGLLIGERSWGGVVGITDHGQLIDGGRVNVPEFATANAKGEFVVEGHGVDPDIVVENDAKSVIEGKDPQLERGVAELLKKLEQNTPKLPEHSPYPVKVK
ncbi:MAG: PDZ domain-containing protein [Bryobacteraceae bacterium]|nr:PDZ domain-containing protein [Bryobacteraceae bacterium]